jgi:RNase adapter protein RapZ
VKLIILSGRSGSGKSISLHVLEDLGYYCIDNLPAPLLPALIEHVQSNYHHVALGIDARNLPTNIDHFHSFIQELQHCGHTCEIIYLDADDNILIKRFSETRRKHPLTNHKVALHEAIQQEKKLLEPIAHLADLRVDTSSFAMQQLRELICQRVFSEKPSLSILIQSFGYKFGIPQDSDFVFDVRCLANPYWQPELRPYSGFDQEIADFLQDRPETIQLLHYLEQFFDKWIPLFAASNRSYMTISIGCTGGRHRSVYIAEKLLHYLSKQGKNIQMRHRELS